MTKQSYRIRVWDQATYAERRSLLLKDKSMRQPRFERLVNEMASSNYATLRPLQQELVTSSHLIP